jgi:hypothetical protein
MNSSFTDRRYSTSDTASNSLNIAVLASEGSELKSFSNYIGIVNRVRRQSFFYCKKPETVVEVI